MRRFAERFDFHIADCRWPVRQPELAMRTRSPRTVAPDRLFSDPRVPLRCPRSNRFKHVHRTLAPISIPEMESLRRRCAALTILAEEHESETALGGKPSLSTYAAICDALAHGLDVLATAAAAAERHAAERPGKMRTKLNGATTQKVKIKPQAPEQRAVKVEPRP